jgi:hypothetical protein
MYLAITPKPATATRILKLVLSKSKEIVLANQVEQAESRFIDGFICFFSSHGPCELEVWPWAQRPTF